MNRAAKFYLLALGAALGVAQGSLSLAFSVAITGSVLGYFVTMVAWCAGSSLGLWRTTERTSAPRSVFGLAAALAAGIASMLLLPGVLATLAAALATAGCGFFAGRLIALCDLWGMPAGTLMALENTGFVVAFCATIIGLLFVGLWIYLVLVAIIGAVLMLSLPRVRRQEHS